jgi:hypothetical protein
MKGKKILQYAIGIIILVAFGIFINLVFYNWLIPQFCRCTK